MDSGDCEAEISERIDWSELAERAENGVALEDEASSAASSNTPFVMHRMCRWGVQAWVAQATR